MPVDTPLPLRDIHLPGAIAWWPPALGWWLVAGLLLGLVLLLTGLYRRYQSRRLQREALRALVDIENKYAQEKNQQGLVRSLSIWLRRVSISRYPATNVAGLTGHGWLQFLDKSLIGTVSSEAFSTGVGQQLLSAPYQEGSAVDGDQLLALCRAWLMRLPRAKKARS